jgi:hypothetical protein
MVASLTLLYIDPSSTSVFVILTSVLISLLTNNNRNEIKKKKVRNFLYPKGRHLIITVMMFFSFILQFLLNKIILLRKEELNLTFNFEDSFQSGDGWFPPLGSRLSARVEQNMKTDKKEILSITFNSKKKKKKKTL